jgi:putative transposase
VNQASRAGERGPAPRRRLVCPVTAAELEQAYRADALFDAHRDDPEFGSRYLHEEAAENGQTMAGRTAWRIH